VKWVAEKEGAFNPPFSFVDKVAETCCLLRKFPAGGIARVFFE